MTERSKLEAIADLQELNQIVDQLSEESQAIINTATRGIAGILYLVKPELRGVVIATVGLCAEIGDEG